jgi:transcriptional regulator with XRE-family HTH domain
LQQKAGRSRIVIEMGKDKELNKPYAVLGSRLRKLRELHNETLAEVSGAVEIDQEVLEQIEQGIIRPSEDILFLLSSHFQSSKSQADKLFRLAGYQEPNSQKQESFSEQFTPQPAMMVLPIDARIIYSDSVNISANDHGVVLSFMQNAGAKGEPIAVSRVGMSQEHAQNLSELLVKTLKHVGKHKQLNPGNSQDPKKPKERKA